MQMAMCFVGTKIKSAKVNRTCEDKDEVAIIDNR